MIPNLEPKEAAYLLFFMTTLSKHETEYTVWEFSSGFGGGGTPRLSPPPPPTLLPGDDPVPVKLIRKKAYLKHII